MSRYEPLRRLALLLAIALPGHSLHAASDGATKSAPPVISWEDAADHMDATVDVVGKVLRTYKARKGQVYLNFAENWQETLSIYIPEKNASAFPEPPEKLYKGKYVRIRGVIREYKDSPSLTLRQPDAITLLTEAEYRETEKRIAATRATQRAQLAGIKPGANIPANLKPILWTDASREVGNNVTAIGRVVRTHRHDDGTVTLNFKQDYRGSLTIRIPADAADLFAEPPQKAFKNRIVKVYGKVFRAKQSPTISIDSPGAIMTLADDTPLPKPASGPGADSASTSTAKRPLDPIQPTEYLPIVPWQKAEDFIGQEVLLVGKVVRTSVNAGGYGFLNFDEDHDGTLSVFIHKAALPYFPEPLDKAYQGRKIRVRGLLYRYKGTPSINAPGPDLITFLPDDAPLPAEPIIPLHIHPTMTAGPGETITLATFNLHNMFDAWDDPYRADTAANVLDRAMMEKLAGTIRQLDADVLGICEIENRGILDLFCKVLLHDMGYEPVLIEGNDGRGIDVAVLSRLPVGPVTSHQHLRFPGPNGSMTRFRRDLLQVRIEPPGAQAFDMYVVHLKSKSGDPAGTLDIRMAEARQARLLLDRRLAAEPDARFVICGDFNDTIDSQPLQTLLGSGPAALHHFVADVPDDQRVTFNKEPHRAMIDFIFASPAMARDYVSDSYRIVHGSMETIGSDHNPVVAQFKTR